MFLQGNAPQHAVVSHAIVPSGDDRVRATLSVGRLSYTQTFIWQSLCDRCVHPTRFVSGLRTVALCATLHPVDPCSEVQLFKTLPQLHPLSQPARANVLTPRSSLISPVSFLPDTGSGVYVPTSRGSAEADKASCCRLTNSVAASCCRPGETEGRDNPITHPPTQHSKVGTVEAKRGHEAEDALHAHNSLRDHPLAWDDQLAALSAKTLDSMWTETCTVSGKNETGEINDDLGVNTFALAGCDSGCSWGSVLNSWTSEHGSTGCSVAHKATVLNPDTKRVGCTQRSHNDCQMNVCVYDKRPTDRVALTLSSPLGTIACDTTACCGALPCKNTECGV